MAAAAFAIVSVLVVWLATILWPLPPRPDLDPSWQLILVDAWLHNRQFGPDIVFTWGPLGFVFSQFVLPDALGAKLWFEMMGRLAIAAVLVALAWPLPVMRRLIWLATLFVMGIGWFDVLALVAVAGLLTTWLLPPDRPVRTALAIALIGAASLIKLTLMTMAIAGMVLMAAAALAERRPTRAAVIAAGIPLSILTWWMLAGQSLWNLPTYLKLASEISAGYTSAMTLEEPQPVFLAGLGVMLAHAFWVLPALGDARSDWKRLPVIALLVLVVLVSWKHGYTRGGTHAHIFFLASLLMATLMPAMAGARRWAEIGSLVAVSASVIALEVSFPGTLQRNATFAAQRASAAVRQIGNISSVVEAHRRGTDAAATDAHLPRTTDVVGSQPIDLVGYSQGRLYLNGLTHHPRPVPQSYAAYTATLIEANRAFLAGEQAPPYLLAALHVVDGRYPTQEDAAVVIDLPRRYEPLLEEDGLWLLSRRRVQPSAASAEVILDVTVAPGEWIDLPAHESFAHVIRIEARPSLRARLRTLLYRQPLLHMTVADESLTTFDSRVIPPIASSGFLIQPRVTSADDFAAWLRGESRGWNQRLALGTGLGEADAWPEFRVQISRLPDVRLTEDPSALVAPGHD